MSAKNPPVIHPYFYSPVKRVFDVLVSLGLLIILSPSLIFISFLVLLTSGWPVIFRQNRIGLNQLTFKLYKFRTMKLGAEKSQQKLAEKNEAPFPMFKLHHDPRFVGIGRWLSNTGLDELPQLLNILKGDMSFVGPRPLPIKEASAVHQLYPDWQFRELVKPGIFSQWSLDADRHSSIEHWRQLDLMTVTNGGLSYELKIIEANTLKALIWTLKTSLTRIKLRLKQLNQK